MSDKPMRCWLYEVSTDRWAVEMHPADWAPPEHWTWAYRRAPWLDSPGTSVQVPVLPVDRGHERIVDDLVARRAEERGRAGAAPKGEPREECEYCGDDRCPGRDYPDKCFRRPAATTEGGYPTDEEVCAEWSKSMHRSASAYDFNRGAKFGVDWARKADAARSPGGTLTAEECREAATIVQAAANRLNDSVGFEATTAIAKKLRSGAQPPSGLTAEDGQVICEVLGFAANRGHACGFSPEFLLAISERLRSLPAEPTKEADDGE